MRSAFTILELLFGLAVVAVLVALAIPASSGIDRYAARVKSISNLRQIGVAARLFANDHQQELPAGGVQSAVISGRAENWPALFCVYLTPSDPRVFLDPTDPAAARLPLAEVLSNAENNTGYIYNGFEEMGDNGAAPPTISLARLEQPAATLLMSQKASKAKDFYVQVLTRPLNALADLLDPAAFEGGAHYLFTDGSVRYLKQSEYANTLWLGNKSIELPGLPISNPLPRRGVLNANAPSAPPGRPGRGRS